MATLTFANFDGIVFATLQIQDDFAMEGGEFTTIPQRKGIFTLFVLFGLSDRTGRWFIVEPERMTSCP
jgi:hypothetical protein